MARKLLNGDYSAKLKALRGFVDFDYDLRRPLHSSQKRKINRYYNALEEIKARSNRVYRSRDRGRVVTAQKFGRNEFDNLPGFKVAFLESNNANPIERIRFGKGGKLIVTRRYFKMEFIEFDQRALIRNTEREIERALSEAKPAFSYRIAAGKYSIERPRTREALPGEIQKLMNRYGIDPTVRKHKNDRAAENHYWQNWLTGVIPMYVRNQSELDDFRQREDKIRKANKKKRKAKRARARRAKNNRRR